MLFIYEILVSILLFPFISSSNYINVYNISLGIPINITDLELQSVYVFNLKVRSPKILRIKVITDDSLILTLFGEMTVKEHKELDEYYLFGGCALTKTKEKNYRDGSIRYLFSYDIYEKDTNFCSIIYSCKKEHDYFYIVVDLTEPYDLPIGISKTFYKVSEFFVNYFFITGVERFQRINVTMTAKGTTQLTVPDIYILENNYRTEKYYYYEIRKRIFNYNCETISEYENIYAFNFIYDIKKYSTVVLSLKFNEELYFLDLKIDAAGGEISFYNNYGEKNITDLKANYPYYLCSSIIQYQTVLITIITKYYESYPFDMIYIYEFKNKKQSVNGFLNAEIKTNPLFHNNNEELNISFSYQMNSSDITDIGFQFIPKFNLDYLFVKMHIAGGVYYLNDEDIQKIYNVYPGYDISFWIDSKGDGTITIIANLKYNYSEENPLNKVDIYDYITPLDNNKYYNHIKQSFIPDRNNKYYFTNLSYIIENPITRYVLLKINPSKLIEYLEFKINIHKKEYDLINNTPIKINNINPGNLFYFFINANIYNKLFIKFIFNSENNDPIKYITINEYAKRDDLSYTKSTNQTFYIIKKGNESMIELTYSPIYPYSKYIAFILEANSKFDYLITQVDIGGGYYEFNYDKNITKLIAGTVYYFVTKISPIQNLKMKISIDDDIININPFTFANIYEKEKKEDNKFNKYYNQSLTSEHINGKLVQYLSYPINHFSTNYILIELIPNINIEKIQISYEITNIFNLLNNGESININKLLKDISNFYFINSKQYQQININLTLNNSQELPFDFIEIYEFSEKYHYSTYNKFTNKSLQFLKNNNEEILSNTFSYMIDSFYTNFILMKINPKFEYENLNIKINVGGGCYDIDKGAIKNITNLFSNYSYYFFVLSSKGDKLNIKLILNSTEIKNPFNTLNVLEYSSKNSPSFYLQKTNEKYNTEIKDNKLMLSMSYLSKNNSTNFIALELTPNYNLSFLECLIESEIEDKGSSSFSLVKILIIVLIGIIIITTIIFIIYIKKFCLKSSSIEIENIYKNKDNENKDEIKFELALLPIDPKSSSN